MTSRVHHHPELIFSVGTQVVATRAIPIPDDDRMILRGSVGVIANAPDDPAGDYRVRFADGTELNLTVRELAPLAKFREDAALPDEVAPEDEHLFDRVAFQCVIGSRAYGLADEDSDIDRRGFFVPTASRHWSLNGVPEQIECDRTQEAYWEVEKFVRLALKANPNVLECLYSPVIERATPLAERLLDMRDGFLSKLVYQTYNGYALSQFKKIAGDVRNRGRVKWKHAMHLIRLLLAGIDILHTGTVPVTIGKHRERLLAIKRGERTWDDVDRWRHELHAEFDQALNTTSLPDRPDFDAANDFLIDARRTAFLEEDQ